MASVLAAGLIKSPAQAAADAAAPPPDVLTAPVEYRVLATTVVMRGLVSASRTTDIAPLGVAGDGSARPVVTKVMTSVGSTVRPGQVLLEISGRPVFALAGRVPVYRDLKPGAHGDDVRQLQQALRGLHHDTGSDAAGVYGPGTKAAVGELYRSSGYDPVLAGGGDGSSVAAAQAQVTKAQRALDELLATAKPDQQAVGWARDDVRTAKDALEHAESVSGPMLPASEVVFLAGFPARVDASSAKVGGTPGEKLMTLSSGQLVIKGSAAADQKGLIRPGEKVHIFSETIGEAVTGTVTSVAPGLSPQQAGGQEGPGYAMTVRPDRALPGSWAGQDVRMTIEAASSKTKVLVVPLSAVSAGADTRTTVTVLATGGVRRRVEVRPGISGGGYVQITPVPPGGVAPGDKVIVGIKAGLPAAGSADEVPDGQ